MTISSRWTISCLITEPEMKPCRSTRSRVDANQIGCCAHLLQEEHQDGDEGGPLLLQGEEGARRPHKQLGLAVRHVVLEAVLVDDHLHRLSIGRHQVVRPSVLARHLVPVDWGKRGGRKQRTCCEAAGGMMRRLQSQQLQNFEQKRAKLAGKYQIIFMSTSLFIERTSHT